MTDEEFKAELAKRQGTMPAQPAQPMMPQMAQPQPMAMPSMAPPQAVPMMGWQQPPPPQAVPQPVALLVPVKVDTMDGEATVYVQFGPEAMANPPAVVNAMLQQGIPVKTWQRNNSGGGGGGGGNSGPWQRRGGYNR